MVMVALLGTVFAALDPELRKKLKAAIKECFIEADDMNACMQACIEKHPMKNSARYECGIANCTGHVRKAIQCIKDHGFDLLQ
ncbi:hypothetical protein Q1695_003860 [Nippostrongylus brasiliensis]|nr:hypothetical protein Q1695_003860 [Nippostrongylus brasiliensis]